MIKKIMMILLATSLLTSCGGDGKKEDKKEDSIKLNTVTKTEEEKVEGVTKVYLTGNDQMKYNKNQITVKAGDEVVLTFEHVGKLPKETMGHNFVLLKKGTDIQKFGQEAVEYKDNDYIPEDSDAIIVHTKMLGGGEKVEITFEAPEEKGNYDYVCSFPGHIALMKGILTVE